MEQEGMPFRAGWKTNQGLDSALIYLQRPPQPDPAQPGLQITPYISFNVYCFLPAIFFVVIQFRGAFGLGRSAIFDTNQYFIFPWV
jgi:hypothetical protein